MSEVTSSQNVISNNTITGGGTDYNSGPYTVMFHAGVTSVPFDVTITDDNILEGNESFSLMIMQTSKPDRVTRVGDYQAEVTIVDNDCKWFMLYHFVISKINACKYKVNYNFTINRDHVN